ncbi:uncharacterized membrane protein YoaK (UPF0700 family) [Ciceribacter lividus]|uniref:Uncharacterized membrane protein YoaK (UPF0700 family) n=1 Tax=Ciceribacter lividus TaxID=1197950 RepID=A0A6I7HJJ2_9HYPH|nr:YoaK family protein [Ciceribacter lividus]RCW22703.1 uncharacterized membrane protein YoaK (UPF0700 family) [Ciceribacter lividus]
MQAYIRSLADRHRTEASDRHLAFYLTFVAGAANAGGFMAVQQYTSHMSGMVSSMADNLVLGNVGLFLGGVSALLAFIFGAATSAILINWAKRKDLHSQYALPLAFEAVAMAAFGLSGLLDGVLTAVTVALLCFIMGLQNAMITKLSGARIRTTHVTGLVTDVGIEIGKLFYRNSPTVLGRPPVMADRDKLGLLSTLISLFFIGGICGAVLFKTFGIPAAMVLALPLMLFAAFPLVSDLQSIRQRWT